MAATLTRAARTSDDTVTTDMYASLGVRTFINATGHTTVNGGSLMPREVVEAIVQGARAHVPLETLQRAAGERIAAAAGAPAAMISSGAAGSILLAAAGALTGSDRSKIMALPDVPDGKDQVVVWGPQGPNYMYQAVRAAGGKLAHIGVDGETMAAEHYRAALRPETAAVLLVLAHVDQNLAQARSPQTDGRRTGGWEGFIGQVAAAATAAGVPVLVDAASELPPRALVRQLLDLGVAGIIVSGGKAIRGPQATGLVLGRPDLIEAAFVNSSPRSAIGRALKVGKEDICGLVAAVERFFALDEQEQLADWRRQAETIAGAADGHGGATAQAIEGHPDYGRPPLAAVAAVHFEDRAATVAAALEAGEPGIRALQRGADRLVFSPMALLPGDAETIARRLRECIDR